MDCPLQDLVVDSPNDHWNWLPEQEEKDQAGACGQDKGAALDRLRDEEPEEGEPEEGETEEEAPEGE